MLCDDNKKMGEKMSEEKLIELREKLKDKDYICNAINSIAEQIADIEIIIK